MTFETIDRDLLVTATGGAGQNNGNGDYADEYANTLKNDWNHAQNHANNAVSNFKQGQYWNAAKEVGKQTVDNVHMIGDALKPVKELFVK